MASGRLALPWVTFLLVIFVRPAALPTGKPVLSKYPTQDVTVTCCMTDFMDKHRPLHLNYLRVAKNVSGRTEILGSMDLVTGEVSISKHLSPSSGIFFKLTGNKHDAMRDSWLKLSLADVHDGSLYCETDYLESGGPSETWFSEVFPFTTDSTTHTGIAVTVHVGLTLQCSYRADDTMSNESSVRIVRKNEGKSTNLCQQQDSQQRLCDFKHAFDGGLAVKRAHVFDHSINDDDEETYQCLPSQAPEQTSTVPTTAVTSPLPTTTTDQPRETDKMLCIISGVLNGVLILVIVGLIVSLIVLNRRRKVNKCEMNTENTQTEGPLRSDSLPTENIDTSSLSRVEFGRYRDEGRDDQSINSREMMLTRKET